MNTLETIVNTYNILNKEIEERRKALEALDKEFIKTTKNKTKCKSLNQYMIYLEIKETLDKHPEIEYIFWYHYTPSWNDGDPCYPSSTIDDYKVVYKETLEKHDEDDIDEDDLDSGDIDLKIKYNEEFIMEAFGTDIKIKCYRDKIEIEDYYCGY